jgi:DNA-binding FadR family transcriptional regulator
MSMQLPLPQAPRFSLVESTIEVIRFQVESGAWRIGERIPKEAELAEMLQVGRNTVREAVRVLSHAKILEVRQGDGTYVRSNIDPAETMRRVSRASILEHFELRAILETEAARLAAMRRTDEDLEQLARLLDARGGAPKDGDIEAFADRDVAFHSAVAHAAHNTALEELYRYFSNSARVNTHALFLELQQDPPGADMAAHAKLLAAIRSQHPDQAAKAARSITTAVIDKLTELLGK